MMIRTAAGGSPAAMAVPEALSATEIKEGMHEQQHSSYPAVELWTGPGSREPCMALWAAMNKPSVQPAAQWQQRHQSHSDDPAVAVLALSHVPQTHRDERTD